MVVGASGGAHGSVQTHRVALVDNASGTKLRASVGMENTSFGVVRAGGERHF